MTALRRRMIEAMQLRGLAPATQQSYLLAIHSLARHFNLPPDHLTPDHLRQYFLYLRNDKQVARSTSTVALCALKFFYEHTLQRPWPLLDGVNPRFLHPGATALKMRIFDDNSARFTLYGPNFMAYWCGTPQ